MSEFVFTSFSSRSFEHLTQALCEKILGPGARVYGDGPDGGREASFEGKVPYPSPADCWDGYIVVQAKFRQKDSGKDDPTWLISQLNGEIAKFEEPERHLRVPEYYIAVTNITLSPMFSGEPTSPNISKGRKRRMRKGGQQKLDAFMEGAKGTLWTKGYDIWHADKLASLLRSQEAIRRTYACWLSSSDVLADVIDHLKTKQPDFEDTIRRFLARELWEGQWANLDHTGHDQDEQTLLANVFFDLPYTFENSEPKEGEIPETLAAYLMDHLRNKLDPKTLSLLSTRSSSPEDNRFVILGGPGQGKSTLGQFLAQLYRAALLKDRRQRLEVEKRRALKGMLEQCEKAGISLPEARRFPIRIELPRFADAIRPDSAPSLLEYIACQISQVADANVEIENLRQWLIHYPWLLILDGLDEVPTSGNRGPVLTAINRFWDEVMVCSADIAMIVTSRPQGFNDDLSPVHYNHIRLSKLTPPQALFYGKSLLEHRVKKPQVRNIAMMRLTSATEKTATARLMTTPLQVTIMAALIQGKGELPQDRWSLFKGYFEVIRDRESNKPEAVARMLKEHASHIEFIHQQAGLILQIDSERKDGADSSMSIERLKEMMVRRLEDAGHSHEDSQDLAGQIVGDSMTRLVLLAGEKDERVSFEVRSLQEFMAASCLMTGHDQQKLERLEHIAGKGHWRHVFLFAAGRCFSDVSAEHLRDSIYRILQDMDEFDDNVYVRETRAGARVALELLEDANAANEPMAYRHLMKRSLTLLTIDRAGFADRLATVYRQAGMQETRKFVEDELQRGISREPWRMLFALNELGIAWAEEVLLGQLPYASESPLNLLVESLPAKAKAVNIMELARVAATRTSLGRYYPKYHLELSRKTDLTESPNSTNRDFRDVALNGVKGLKFGFRPLDDNSDSSIQFVLGEIFDNTNNLHAALNEFEAQPGRTTLAEVLSEMANLWPTAEDYDARMKCSAGFPWVAHSISWVCENGAELKEASSRAQCGSFGTLEDWLAAEQRWVTRGVDKNDIKVLVQEGIGKNIANIGSFFPSILSRESGADESGIEQYIDASLEIKSSAGFIYLLDSFMFLSNGGANISDNVFNRLAENADISSLAMNSSSIFDGIPESRWSSSGMSKLYQRLASADMEFEASDSCRRHFRAFPDHLALLCQIVNSGVEAEDAELIDLAAPFMDVGEQPPSIQGAFATLCARNSALERINISQLVIALTASPDPWTASIADALKEQTAIGNTNAVELALTLSQAGAFGFHSVLSTEADRYRAGFQQKEIWSGLGLPESFYAFASQD